MSKKKTTTKRRRLWARPDKPLTPEQQTGRALLVQNVKLFRDLVACNASVTALQKVWRYIGAAFNQAVGREDEFYRLDSRAYGSGENECERPEHTNVLEAIHHVREASHLLYQSIDIFLRVHDAMPAVMHKYQMESIAKRWHDFVEAAYGYATPPR
jgi:hypothetical protein